MAGPGVMLAVADDAGVYVPPSVDEPSGSQLAVLRELAPVVMQALGDAFRRCGVACLSCDDGAFADEDEHPAGEAAVVEATWWQGAGWQLFFSAGAAEATLAAQLGHQTLVQHALTDLDLRLLEIPVRTLCQELARQEALGPVRRAVSVTRGNWGGDGVGTFAWRVRLQHGGVTGDVVLRAQWRELADALAPAGDGGRLRRGQLLHAPVLAEVVVPGPSLTVGDLAQLQPGDVLTLGSLEHLSQLRAHGRAVAAGRVGVKGSRLAINITNISPLEEE